VPTATRYQVDVDYIANACLHPWYCAAPPDAQSGDITRTSHIVAVTPGAAYRARAYAGNGSGWKVSDWLSFRCFALVAPATPSPTPSQILALTSNKASYAPGGPITVSWTGNVSGAANDWVGIVAAGGAWDSANDGLRGSRWDYAGAQPSDSRTLVAPSVPGSYQAVFFRNLTSSYKEAARSAVFIVTSPTSGNDLSCAFAGSTVAHGSSIIAYQASVVPYGSSCLPQTRTCANGVLSGMYTSAACVVAAQPAAGSSYLLAAPQSGPAPLKVRFSAQFPSLGNGIYALVLGNGVTWYPIFGPRNGGIGGDYTYASPGTYTASITHNGAVQASAIVVVE
jgi:hypothetical protein